jgi:hypothetical protein
LKGKIDSGLMLQEQDFTGTQNELSRELEKSLAEGNWQNAFNIQKMQQEFDVQKQEAQQTWASAERNATQGWQTGERLSDQDFTAAQNVLAQKQQLALQSNDILAQKDIADSQAKLQLNMQTANFSQQEKMAYLDDQLATAKADKDVNRQKSILEFQHGQEMETLRSTQGFEKAMQYNDQQQQLALQKNDHVATQALQTERLNMEVSEKAKDRVLAEASLKLQEKGVDMQAVQQQYEQLADQEARGIIEAGASTKYLQDTLNKNGVTGVTLTTINAEDQSKKVVDAQYASMMYQFAKTHPEMQDKTTESGLSQEGMAAFSKFFNESTYGEGTKTVEDLTNKLSGTITDPAKKTEALNNASEWSMKQHVDGKGFWNPDIGVIDNPPAVGSIIKMGAGSQIINGLKTGVPYEVLTGIAENTDGENYQYFTVKNLYDNTVITVQASND